MVYQYPGHRVVGRIEKAGRHTGEPAKVLDEMRLIKIACIVSQAGEMGGAVQLPERLVETKNAEITLRRITDIFQEDSFQFFIVGVASRTAFFN